MSTLTDGIALVDHHCHGVIAHDPGPEEFALLASESDWPPVIRPGVPDSPFWISARRLAGPELGLEDDLTVEAYTAARADIGADSVNRRLLAATGIDRYVIETGFLAARIAAPDAMAELTGRSATTVVRLEALAEGLAATTTAQSFAADFAAALHAQLAAPDVVGVKTVAAYRFGLDLPAAAPTSADVAYAAGRWLAGVAASGSSRITDRTLIGHLVWEAIGAGTVIQVHVGFGDPDIVLHLCDPSRLTPLLEATRGGPARFALLHCYPFVREAGILAHLYPHVWFDTSSISHYAGPSVARIVAESLEVAPATKLLYASDAYGLAEHYLVSSRLWRDGLGRVLDAWTGDRWITATEAEAIAESIGAGNARDLYGFERDAP